MNTDTSGFHTRGRFRHTDANLPPICRKFPQRVNYFEVTWTSGVIDWPKMQTWNAWFKKNISDSSPAQRFPLSPPAFLCPHLLSAIFTCFPLLPPVVFTRTIIRKALILNYFLLFAARVFGAAIYGNQLIYNRLYTTQLLAPGTAQNEKQP